MKRIAAALLVLVLLLAGCANASPTATEPSQTTPIPSDPSGIPDITVPPLELPFSEDPIWQFPKGQDYYFLCPKVDEQYNMNEEYYMIFVTIPLISREEIDLDRFQLTLPLKNVTYEVRKKRVILPLEIFPQLFYAYHDWDWTEYLLAKEIEYAVINEKPISEADRARLNAYYAKEEEVYKAYEALTPDTLPGSLSDFFAYQITLCFSFDAQTPEESFSYMDISWPGVSFRHDCGRISFVRKPKTDFGNYASIISAKLGFDMQCGFIDSARYLSMHQFMYNFTAKKDLTLESISFPDGYGTHIRSFVELTLADGTYMQLAWDGKSPLPVQEGTLVAMLSYCTDPRTVSSVPIGERFIRLNMECEGKSYFGTQLLWQDNDNRADYYELAAFYFDNIDIPAYYRDYYSYHVIW